MKSTRIIWHIQRPSLKAATKTTNLDNFEFFIILFPQLISTSNVRYVHQHSLLKSVCLDKDTCLEWNGTTKHYVLIKSTLFSVNYKLGHLKYFHWEEQITSDEIFLFDLPIKLQILKRTCSTLLLIIKVCI